MFRDLLLALIHAYRRHASPRKGFGCAYRIHAGRASCSAVGLRAVRRHGAWLGLLMIRERTRRCGLVHRRYASPRLRHAQRGFCDAGCDLPDCSGCDISPADVCDSACCLDFGDGCDLPSWGRKRKHDDAHPKSGPFRRLIDASPEAKASTIAGWTASS